MAASVAIASVAFRGARLEATFDHSWWPGTARSRLNAYIIREALVRPEPPQKNWPMVEITITALNPARPSAVAKMPIDEPAPYGLLVEITSAFLTANRKHSSRIQPPIAE